MISRIALLIIIITSIFSCFHDKNKDAKNSEFLIKHKLKEITLPLPKGQIWSANITRFVEIEDSLHLLIYYYPKPAIFDYNVITEELSKTIKLPDYLHGISDFNYYNKDSILLMGSSEYKYNNDSSIVLINDKGQYLASYPLTYYKLINSYNYPEFIKTTSDTSLNETAFDSILFNWAIFNVIIKPSTLKYRIYSALSNSNIGTSKNVNLFPVLAYYDFKEKEYKVSNIKYPDIKKDEYLPNANYYTMMEFGIKKQLHLSFMHTPKILILNYEMNVLDSVVINSKYASPAKKTNMPYLENEQRHYPVYLDLIHLPKSNKYLRLISITKNIQLAVVTDEQFNYIGETILDNGFIEQINSEGIWTSDIKGDSIYYTLWDYEFGEYNEAKFKYELDSLIAIEKSWESQGECKPNGLKKEALNITEYANKQWGIRDSNYALVIIDGGGCPGCVDYVMRFLSANKQVLFDISPTPVYLVYRENNTYHANLKRALLQYQLEPSSKIFTDSLILYEKYNPYNTGHNPRLVLFKDQKMLLDSEYLPDALDGFPNAVIDFLDFETN
ncbi:MAG: hypothetical protein JXR60_07315 [Bacteroidales bacterium]|nr:hypothetical protein [Bacteroidales bacterium]